MTWDESIERVLIPRDELAARVGELAGQISADYQGKELLLVGVLRGAVFFMADLARRLTVPCSLDFMAVSSYGSATDSSGVVRILKDLDTDIQDRHVLIVEDIIDSGLTLNYLMKSLSARHPASLEVCALLTKPVASAYPPALQVRRVRDPRRVRRGLRIGPRRALPHARLHRCPEQRGGGRRRGCRGFFALTVGYATVWSDTKTPTGRLPGGVWHAVKGSREQVHP